MKIHLNADLREVLSRLAGQENGTVADRVMHVPRKDDYSGSIPDGTSTLEEAEH